MKHVARTAVLFAALAVMASGCAFFSKAVRNYAAPSPGTPWWCASDVGVDLDAATCRSLSMQLDGALSFAQRHPHASDATAAGAQSEDYMKGVGARFVWRAPSATFVPQSPDAVLYDGEAPGAQVVALEWNVTGASAPNGFVGSNDVWRATTGGWRLRAWIVRPFENQRNPFASTHPCLGAGGAIYDVEAACYTTTHPLPLEILVTNDDGYRAAGIDAVVEALRDVPGVNLTVVAPATNQSGSGDRTTPGGVTAFNGTTLSGHPAVAVNGFPADSVLHALNGLHENPDLVVSGINEGQNIGPLVDLSGTVGAARTASRRGVPSLASSQGFGSPPDFPSGSTAVLTWVEDFRLGRAGPPFETVANLNVPTCTSGSIRGTVNLPVATALNGRPFNPSNCTSTVTAFVDDVDGFINGFITLSDAELN